MKMEFENIRNKKLEKYLESVSKEIGKREFSFGIYKHNDKKNGKDVYIINGSKESYFAEKQIQNNIRYTYSVKQSDRDLIVPQLKSVLKDNFSKYIIKVDIESFYESIDRSRLIHKLNENPVLSLSTRKLIAKLLRDYGDVSGHSNGIPRGVGVSAYLSELYLKEFDRKVKEIDGLIYFSRYVDDIVIVLSPDYDGNINKFFNKLNAFLLEDGLKLKDEKSELLDFSKGVRDFSFDYLGYKFKKVGKVFKLAISDNRSQKYKLRIRSVLDRYNKNRVKQPIKAKKELYMRLGYLTSNTKLSNNKGNALVGIYHSNKWVDDESFLRSLDSFLQGNSRSILDASVRDKISKYSFERGFKERRYRFYSPNNLRNIVKVWA